MDNISVDHPRPGKSVRKAALYVTAGAICAVILFVTMGRNGRRPAPQEQPDAPIPTVEEKSPVTMPLSSTIPIRALELSIRVVDQSNQPVDGVSILVAGDSDPFECNHSKGDVELHRVFHGKHGYAFGHTFVTGENGTCSVVLASNQEVLVTPAAQPGVRLTEGSTVLATPPARLELKIQRLKRATVSIKALDVSTGQYLVGFQCGINVEGDSNTYWQNRTVSDVLDMVVDLPSGADSGTAKVTLIRPPFDPPVRESTPVFAGKRSQVELLIQSQSVVRGNVRTLSGLPIQGAKVFFGTMRNLKGDELFKPVDPSRIPDFELTDQSGAFSLRGQSRFITIWHPNHSPVTVPVREAHSIQLPGKQSLSGRLCDAMNRPISGATVTMDRSRRATTDNDGRFTFKSVDTGVRGLQLEDGRRVGVIVKANEDVTVTIGPGIDFTLTVPSFARGVEEGRQAVLVGTGDLFSVVNLRLLDRSISLNSILPGEYALILDSGSIGNVRVNGGTCDAQFGACEVEVHNSGKERVICLIPNNAHELIRMLIERIATREVTQSKSARYLHLSPGQYEIYEVNGGLSQRVLLQASKAEVVLGN